MRAAERHDRTQRRFVRVGVEPRATRCDAADRLDVCHLETQQGRARVREHSQVSEVPVGHRAVHGRVLAHRRYHDAVLEREATQPDGFKQGAGHRMIRRRKPAEACPILPGIGRRHRSGTRLDERGLSDGSPQPRQTRDKREVMPQFE